MLSIIILTLIILGAFAFVVRYIVRIAIGKQATCHNAVDSPECEACMHAMRMRAQSPKHPSP